MILPTGPHQRRDAFTFLEILIVASLLLVLTTLAIPRFRRSYDHLVLTSYVERFRKLAECAHELSMVEGKIYKITIRSDRAAFQLVKESLDPDLSFASVQGLMGKEQKMPSGSLIQASSEEIFFYPDGQSTESEVKFSVHELETLSLEIASDGKTLET